MKRKTITRQLLHLPGPAAGTSHLTGTMFKFRCFACKGTGFHAGTSNVCIFCNGKGYK